MAPGDFTYNLTTPQFGAPSNYSWGSTPTWDFSSGAGTFSSSSINPSVFSWDTPNYSFNNSYSAPNLSFGSSSTPSYSWSSPSSTGFASASSYYTGNTSGNTATSTSDTSSATTSTDDTLTDAERKAIDEDIKNNNKKLVRKSAGTAAGVATGGLIFATPEIYRAARAKRNITEMFVKDNLALAEKYPDLFTDAQRATYKLEAKYARDIKAASSSSDIATITSERDKFRSQMQKALKNARNGHPEELAKVTAKFEAASKENGLWTRLTRRAKGEPTRVSRMTAVNNLPEGKLKVKPVKAGTSFLRNFTLSGGIMSGGLMAAMHIGGDFLTGKIQQAYAVDKETGRKQLLQSAGSGLLSGVAWAAGDALGRTVAKKFLVKAATKVAAKCTGKLLGAAIGSIIPGLGTIAGLVIGGLADFAISKLVKPVVLPPSAPIQKITNEGSHDDKLALVVDQYQNGLDVSDTTLNVMKRKLGDVAFGKIQQIHNMTDEQRMQLMTQQQTA